MFKMKNLKIADRVKILAVDNFGAGVFEGKNLIKAWRKKYPNEDPEGRVLLSDYCVNTISGCDPTKDTKNEDIFLFRVKRGFYRIYDIQRDGKWKRIKNQMVQED